MASKTIAASGADYTSIAAWHTYVLGTGASETGTCTGSDELSGGSGVVLSATGHTFLLTADSGNMVNAPSYAAATSKARISNSTSLLLRVQGTGWTVEKLGIVGTAGSGVAALLENTLTFRRCVVVTTSTQDCLLANTDSTTITVSNCAIVGLAANIYLFETAGGATGITINGYQCSLLMGSSSYAAVSSTSNCTINCYAFIVQGRGIRNFYSGDGGTVSGEDNVSQTTDAPGSNTRKSISGLFKDTGSTTWDLNLNGLNGGLLTGVADYSGSAGGDTATDIAGNARPLATGFPIDPGCAVANPTGPSILGYYESTIQTSLTSLTFNVTVPASINSTVVLFVEEYTGVTVSNADWNGGALTHEAAADASNATISSEAWILKEAQNSGSGSHTLTVNYSGTATRTGACAYVVAYASATVAPDYDTANGASATSSTTITASVTAAGTTSGIFHMRASSSDDGAVPDSPSVLRSSVTGAFDYFQTATRAASGGSDAAAWTANSAAVIVLSVLALKPGSASSFLPANPVIVAQAIKRASRW